MTVREKLLQAYIRQQVVRITGVTEDHGYKKHPCVIESISSDRTFAIRRGHELAWIEMAAITDVTIVDDDTEHNTTEEQLEQLRVKISDAETAITTLGITNANLYNIIYLDVATLSSRCDDLEAGELDKEKPVVTLKDLCWEMIEDALNEDARLAVTYGQPGHTIPKCASGRVTAVRSDWDISLKGFKFKIAIDGGDWIRSDWLVKVEKLETEVTKKPRDIAKQRWQVCENAIECDHTELVSNEFATYEQRKLMAKAPELADLMRDNVNKWNGIDPDGPWGVSVIKRIKLLRSLGIINVAPWYKGDE